MPFVFGNRMLDDEALEEAGICTRTLHKWYLTMSRRRREGQLSMTFTDALLRTGDGPNHNALDVRDLFDLFNFRPMEIALVKFYELYLCRRNQVSPPNHIVFLDPAGVRAGNPTRDIVRYISKGLEEIRKNKGKKRYLMIPFNERDHWILIVIVPEHNVALYFNSLRNLSIHDGISHCILRAYDDHLQNMGLLGTDIKLKEMYDVECHQQGPTEHCGFYVCHHMRLITERLAGNPADFRLPSRQLTNHELSCVREELSLFINTEVIDSRGQYHASGLQ